MLTIADAVVINLTRRPDRLAAFMAGWNRAAAYMPVRVIEAVDTGTPEGCRLSHVAALQGATGPVLVMEDDCVFAETFTLALPDPPDDWAVLRLGGQELGTPIPRTGVWVVPSMMVRTHAYIVRDPDMFADYLRHSIHVMRRMSTMALRQYALRVHTVGQGAGVSDIDATVRVADEYWNDAFAVERAD